MEVHVARKKYIPLTEET